MAKSINRVNHKEDYISILAGSNSSSNNIRDMLVYIMYNKLKSTISNRSNRTPQEKIDQRN